MPLQHELDTSLPLLYSLSSLLAIKRHTHHPEIDNSVESYLNIRNREIPKN